MGNSSVFLFFHIKPLEILNLQVGRPTFPLREIFISTVMIKKDIILKVSQQPIGK